MGKRHSIYLLFKRLFDIIFSAICIILSAPIMLVAIIAILIDDPNGSPIYAQTRVGRNGYFFRMYKLRTMHKDAHRQKKEMQHLNEADGLAFKIKDDPRITRVGRFLRKCSIDELPQFFNVLIGDMSVVGPRPPLPEEAFYYNEWHMKRLAVTPGITCYWQIAKNRNDILFDDWVAMDLQYIQNASFKTDIIIIIKTVFAIFNMDGQ